MTSRPRFAFEHSGSEIRAISCWLVLAWQNCAWRLADKAKEVRCGDSRQSVSFTRVYPYIPSSSSENAYARRISYSVLLSWCLDPALQHNRAFSLTTSSRSILPITRTSPSLPIPWDNRLVLAMLLQLRYLKEMDSSYVLMPIAPARHNALLYSSLPINTTIQSRYRQDSSTIKAHFSTTTPKNEYLTG